MRDALNVDVNGYFSRVTFILKLQQTSREVLYGKLIFGIQFVDDLG